jgi:hypothetical protein
MLVQKSEEAKGLITVRELYDDGCSSFKDLARKLPPTERAAIHHSWRVNLQVFTVTFRNVLS